MTSDQKQNSTIDPQTRLKPEYQEGRQAFFAGREVRECVYQFGDQRVAWLTGWYDERTRSRLGHIFESRGIEWP